MSLPVPPASPRPRFRPEGWKSAETEIVVCRLCQVVDSARSNGGGVPQRPMAGEVENDAAAFAEQLTESAAVDRPDLRSDRPDNRRPTKAVARCLERTER